MKATLKNNHLNSNFITNRQPESDMNINDFKYWWDFWIRATTTIPVNKLDLSVSHKSIEIWKNIEFSCHTDAKITSKDQDKINNFELLIRKMKIMYPDYQFQIIPFIVSALSYVSKCFTSYMNSLGFNDKGIKMHVNKMQCAVSCSTV